MSPLSRTTCPPTEGRGFVLIGVVIMVLALTILGLALFSLSGFEAQFVNDSLRHSQAFYTALGGLDRAKFALISTDSLEGVMKGIDSTATSGVVGVVAMQGDSARSVGPVDWWDTTGVLIRVRACEGDVYRTLEGRYKPRRVQNIYKNLLVSADSIGTGYLDVPYHVKQLFLNGLLWQNSPLTGWVDSLPVPPPLPQVGGVPIPDVQNFIAKWKPHATPLTAHAGNYPLDATAQGNPFFIGPDCLTPPHPYAGYHLDDWASTWIRVHGTVVWLLEDGAVFRNHMTILGEESDRLIIVVSHGTNVDYRAPAGLVFNGGLESQVPLFLISDGTIALDHVYDPTSPDRVDYLSLFAGEIFLRAPGPSSMTLSHDAARDDAILNPLYRGGLLPNADPGDLSTFRLVPGTWREVPEPSYH